MPSHSVKQAKVMSAIAHGWRPSGKAADIPVKVAKEFHAADAGKKYGKGMPKSRKRQSGGSIPIRTPNTLNAMMQGVEQDPLNPHAQLGMLAPYAIPGAPMPSARVKRPVHIDEKSEKDKDKGYAKGGLTFSQRWRDVPIQAEDFGDRFFPGFVGQTHGEASPLYTPLRDRAAEMRQLEEAPATFESRWPARPLNPYPLYQQASPFAVGGPIGNQKAPRQEEDFTDTDRQGGIMAPGRSATKDPNEMATEELEDKRQFRSGNPPQRYQMGGFNPEKAMSIGLSRKASQASGGLLKSQIPGRTDQIQASIPKGAYIIPADVVSGMGQGNTDAGGAILGKLMNRGPFGMNLPKRTAGSRVGSRHASLKFSKKFADGGGVGEPEPVLAAGGEFAVLPHEVAALGAGDIDTGHRILDAFVKHVREKTIKTMQGLKPPKGSKEAKGK